MPKTQKASAPVADAPRHLTKVEFGKRLHQAMLAKGLHHAELARRAELPRNNISTYINGRSYPTEQSLLKLARALDMTPEELLPSRQSLMMRGESLPSASMKVVEDDPSYAYFQCNRKIPTKLAIEMLGMLEKARLDDLKKQTA